MSGVFSLSLQATNFGIFLQDGMFEHSGLVDTLSEGVEWPIHSNRGSPDV